MTKREDPDMASSGRIIHLAKRRSPKPEREAMLHEIELSIAGHFREQNERLQCMNQSLADKVQRLTNWR